MDGPAARQWMLLLDCQDKPFRQDGDHTVSGQRGETGIRRDTEITVIHEHVLIAYVIAQLELDEGIALVEGNVKARHIRGSGQDQEPDIAKGFIGQFPDF